MKMSTQIVKRNRVGLGLWLAAIALTMLHSGNLQAQWYEYCCEDRVGDVNGIGGDEPSIGDVSGMIFPIFIAPWQCEYTIPCLGEADINQSGGLNPTCGDITIGDASYLIDYLFITGRLLGLNDCLPISEPTGRFLATSACKTEGAAATSDPILYDQTCIEYEYDGNRVLTIRHINAGFNCCPAYITPEFVVEGGTITVIEGEDLSYGACDCLCLFDVDYEIDWLAPGQYRVIINELYTEPGDDPLDFTIDLSATPSSGTICVDRTHYPWGQ